MGITISSRSPAMAYSNGGLWVSTFDEAGRRCWVHQRSGQRTYQFVGGKPTALSGSPYPAQHRHRSPMPTSSATPWAHTAVQSPATPAPSYAAPPAPSYYGDVSAEMVPYQPGCGAGVPPVSRTGSGNGLGGRLQGYYLRPSSENSWMWNQ